MMFVVLSSYFPEVFFHSRVVGARLVTADSISGDQLFVRTTTIPPYLGASRRGWDQVHGRLGGVTAGFRPLS